MLLVRGFRVGEALVSLLASCFGAALTVGRISGAGWALQRRAVGRGRGGRALGVSGGLDGGVDGPTVGVQRDREDAAVAVVERGGAALARLRVGVDDLAVVVDHVPGVGAAVGVLGDDHGL